MNVAEETAAVVDQLSPEKARSVLDFARFLATQADAEWERRLATADALPNFKHFMADAEREIAEGKTEPLDLNKL